MVYYKVNDFTREIPKKLFINKEYTLVHIFLITDNNLKTYQEGYQINYFNKLIDVMIITL